MWSPAAADPAGMNRVTEAAKATAAKTRGVDRSASGVAKVLRRHHLGTAKQRIAALASLTAADTGQVTDASMEGPFGFCMYASTAGQVVSLDTFYVGRLKGIGAVWQLTAVDVATRAPRSASSSSATRPPPSRPDSSITSRSRSATTCARLRTGRFSRRSSKPRRAILGTADGCTPGSPQLVAR